MHCNNVHHVTSAATQWHTSYVHGMQLVMTVMTFAVTLSGQIWSWTIMASPQPVPLAKHTSLEAWSHTLRGVMPSK